jgi:hypothetical protein
MRTQRPSQNVSTAIHPEDGSMPLMSSVARHRNQNMTLVTALAELSEGDGVAGPPALMQRKSPLGQESPKPDTS